MKTKLSSLPRIGMRIIKSSVAVFLCYIIYLLRGKQGIVFYSQLAVLWCIQPYVDTSLKKALQRTIGTLLGAFFGLIVILFNLYILHENPSYDFFKYLINSIMIIPIIYTTVVLRKPDASYFSCVVFLSIVVMHLEGENPYLFVWNRVNDTMIGILIAVLVNSLHLPRDKQQDILFVSGLDDTLLNQQGIMSAYSRVELNQMLDSGIHFTLSTNRTPASLIAPLRDINLNMPIVAMNGAVLYDLKENKYIKSYVISHEKAMEVATFIRSLGFHCFINSLLEDMLVIYHQKFHNEAEQDIYNKMHTSPYRNYLYRELPETVTCVYIMVIEKTEQIISLADALQKNRYNKSLRIIYYPSTDYPGYSYLKIYNQNAKKENMLHYLKTSVNCNKIITFGTIPEKYDYVVEKDSPNEVVKLIKRLYEPVCFHKLLPCSKKR